MRDKIIAILDEASRLGRGDKWAIIQIIRLVNWKAPSPS